MHFRTQKDTKLVLVKKYDIGSGLFNRVLWIG